jgi:hypothetical protein
LGWLRYEYFTYILPLLSFFLGNTLSLIKRTSQKFKFETAFVASNDIPQLLPFPSPWPGKTSAASAAAGKDLS